MFGLTALPESPGKLVGWSRELAELGRALSSARLLTLVGPGGVGKTTLAVELARRAKRRAGARTWFLDLSSLSDGGQLAGAADLARETGDEPWLLVVDNCEHLVDAAAGLAGSLLERCRRLRLVATSRERLGVRGEVVWAVPPLAPDEAVALFLVHGRAAAGGLQEEAFERTAIERLCRELEGIPLAIELATARTALLSTAEILARLDDRFALLKAGPRSAPWRQRTLAALCYRWEATGFGSTSTSGPTPTTTLSLIGALALGWPQRPSQQGHTDVPCHPASLARSRTPARLRSRSQPGRGLVGQHQRTRARQPMRSRGQPLRERRPSRRPPHPQQPAAPRRASSIKPVFLFDQVVTTLCERL